MPRKRSAPAEPAVPVGRRKLAPGEHLFAPRLSAKKCRAHLWIDTNVNGSGAVVACSVCGRLKQGETMPVGWEPITA